MKQEPAEATVRICHGSAVGILVIHGGEDVKPRSLMVINLRPFLGSEGGECVVPDAAEGYAS